VADITGVQAGFKAAHYPRPHAPTSSQNLKWPDSDSHLGFHTIGVDFLLMKVADRVVRAIVLTTLCAFVLAPWKWMFPLGLISLGIAGAWTLLYPRGILGWAKKPHPRIDDPSLWRVLRLIGGFFLGLTLLIAVFSFR
jgi:hypothetical protein